MWANFEKVCFLIRIKHIYINQIKWSKKKNINEDENAIKDTLSSVFNYGLGGGINTIKEKFAEHLYYIINAFLKEETEGRVKAIKVEVYEHEKNSASYGE